MHPQHIAWWILSAVSWLQQCTRFCRQSGLLPSCDTKLSACFGGGCSSFISYAGLFQLFHVTDCNYVQQGGQKPKVNLRASRTNLQCHPPAEISPGEIVHGPNSGRQLRAVKLFSDITQGMTLHNGRCKILSACLLGLHMKESIVIHSGQSLPSLTLWIEAFCPCFQPQRCKGQSSACMQVWPYGEDPSCSATAHTLEILSDSDCLCFLTAAGSQRETLRSPPTSL